jgi:hypothetical protein
MSAADLALTVVVWPSSNGCRAGHDVQGVVAMAEICRGNREGEACACVIVAWRPHGLNRGVLLPRLAQIEARIRHERRPTPLPATLFKSHVCPPPHSLFSLHLSTITTDSREQLCPARTPLSPAPHTLSCARWTPWRTKARRPALMLSRTTLHARLRAAAATSSTTASKWSSGSRSTTAWAKPAP